MPSNTPRHWLLLAVIGALLAVSISLVVILLLRPSKHNMSTTVKENKSIPAAGTEKSQVPETNMKSLPPNEDMHAPHHTTYGALTIGGADSEGGRSIIQSSDGGYVVAGYTQSVREKDRDLYVVKVDSVGNLQWARTIGGPGYDEGYSIIQTTDGGYIIVGYTSSFGAGDKDIYVVKLDSKGNLQWTRAIGGSGSEEGYSIVQATDGGYVIAGYTTSFGAGSADIYVIRLDSAGNLEWSITIGNSGWDEGNSITAGIDGGYTLAGTVTTSILEGDKDICVVKIDSTGNLEWAKTIGGIDNEVSYSILRTSDGGYAIAGYTISFGAGDQNMYVVKLDSEGNLQWSKAIGSEKAWEWGRSIIQTTDGTYVIAGEIQVFCDEEEKDDDEPGECVSVDAYMVKLDSTGNLDWSKIIEVGGDDAGYSIIQTADGGYALTGGTWSSKGGGEYDVFILRMNTEGNLPAGCLTVSDLGSTINAGSVVLDEILTVTWPTPSVVKDSGRVDSGGTVKILCPFHS